MQIVFVLAGAMFWAVSQAVPAAEEGARLCQLQTFSPSQGVGTKLPSADCIAWAKVLSMNPNNTIELRGQQSGIIGQYGSCVLSGGGKTDAATFLLGHQDLIDIIWRSLSINGDNNDDMRSFVGADCQGAKLSAIVHKSSILDKRDVSRCEARIMREFVLYEHQNYQGSSHSENRWIDNACWNMNGKGDQASSVVGDSGCTTFYRERDCQGANWQQRGSAPTVPDFLNDHILSFRNQCW